MGHSDSEMLSNYYHLHDDEAEASMRALAAQPAEIVSDSQQSATVENSDALGGTPRGTQQGTHGWKNTTPRWQIPEKQALATGGSKRTERGGFEPPTAVTRCAGFRNRSVQPLWHLSQGWASFARQDQSSNLPPRFPVAWLSRYESSSIIAAAIISGSARRPVPLVRHAIHPSPGPTVMNPSARTVARFRWFAG